MAANSQDKPVKAWYLRPYLTGLLVTVPVAIAYLLYPVASSDFSSWNPGRIHSAHQILNNNCQVCHQSPFKKVEDSSCKKCHNIQQHAAKNTESSELNENSQIMKKIHFKSEGSCVDCHFEHSGQSGLLQTESSLCTDCHADLANAAEKPEFKNVTSLANHPEFSISKAGHQRQSLNNATDSNTLKLNHSLHLKKDLRGPEGNVQLDCSDCHGFNSQNGTNSEKITFEKNCRSCHELTFDSSLPDSKVPHGNEQLVLPHLIAEYAKQTGNNQIQQQIESLRAIPGKAPKNMTADPRFIKILEKAKQAEEQLFTKTSCNLCHAVTQIEVSEKGILDSRFEITKPEIVKPWLPHSIFPHSAHQIENCESCHQNVRKSEKTSDVLLPQIDNCQKCHIDSDRTKNVHSQIKSECSSCHNYHDQLPLSEKQKEDLRPLLEQIKNYTEQNHKH